MMRASHNVSAHRRHGAKMSEEFFSAKMDDLGAIDPAVWKQMSPEERQRKLEGDESASA